MVWLVCGLATLTFAQTTDSQAPAAPSHIGIPVIRSQSKLVLVRVMVADKKVWRKGPSEAGKKCALKTEEKFLRLAATQPYIPDDCEGLFVRGLVAKDFRLFVDGVEQSIQSVTSENDGIRVRDNQGLHNEHSQTPAGIWSTTDRRVPRYIFEGSLDYGLLSRNRYDLSFVPKGVESSGCHHLQIKVNRPNSIVAARDQYCASESPSDTLNGTTLGNQLEQDLASAQPGEVPLALQAAVFDGSGDSGRVRIALELPLDSLHWRWRQDWILDATIGVLGTLYRGDGTLAARFSDLGCCTPYSTGGEFGMRGITISRFNSDMTRFGAPPGVTAAILSSREEGTLPVRYETQLDLPPGEYELRMALSDGEKFGRAEAHLNVENYDGKGLALSSIMLCNRFRDAHVAAVESAAANFAPQYVPLVSKGVRVTPAGDTNFGQNEQLFAYFEVYHPQLADGSDSGIQVGLRIVDANTAALVKQFPSVDAATYEQTGSSVVPIAREIPIASLPKGNYRLEGQASDSAGRSTIWRAANFSIQ